MDPVRTRKASRALFYLAVMGACFGIALWPMDYAAIGLVLLIVCIAVAMICRAILSFFSNYDFAHVMSAKKPKRED